MKRPEKEVVVAELTEAFRNADAVYLTEYRGLTVPQISDLREKLGRDTSYTVAKNTLFRIAAKEAGIEGLDEMLTGPSAVVFVKGDFIDAAKILRDFAKTNKASSSRAVSQTEPCTTPRVPSSSQTSSLVRNCLPNWPAPSRAPWPRPHACSTRCRRRPFARSTPCAKSRRRLPDRPAVHRSAIGRNKPENKEKFQVCGTQTTRRAPRLKGSHNG